MRRIATACCRMIVYAGDSFKRDYDLYSRQTALEFEMDDDEIDLDDEFSDGSKLISGQCKVDTAIRDQAVYDEYEF